MRDTFLLLWVGFLVVGVIGSIVSSIRKQVQKAAEPVRRPPRVLVAQRQSPQPLAPPPPPPPRVILSGASVASEVEGRRAAPPRAPAAELPHEFLPARRPSRPHLLRDRRSIVQAVVAAEILGKPRALRDEYL